MIQMSMCMFSINLVVLMLQRSKTKRYNIIQNVCVINQITRVYFLNLRPAVIYEPYLFLFMVLFQVYRRNLPCRKASVHSALLCSRVSQGWL